MTALYCIIFTAVAGGSILRQTIRLIQDGKRKECIAQLIVTGMAVAAGIFAIFRLHVPSLAKLFVAWLS